MSSDTVDDIADDKDKEGYERLVNIWSSNVVWSSVRGKLYLQCKVKVSQTSAYLPESFKGNYFKFFALNLITFILIKR